MPIAVRYCAVAGLSMGLLIAAVVGFNLVVDPFAMYREFDLPGINTRKPAIYQRVRFLKAYEVRRLAPRALVLGSSRSHVGLRMTHPGWTLAPRYNLAFDGATTREMYAYLVHAHSVQPLSQVVLGLDAWHLTSAPSGIRPGFDPAILFDAPGPMARLALLAADARALASLDTLAASLRTLRSQESDEPEWLAPDGQRLGDVFFRRAGELLHEQSPRAYFDAYDVLEAGWRRPSPAAANDLAQFDPAGGSLGWIYRMVDFCRAAGIDLRLYITPAHAHQLEMTEAAGDGARLDAAKRALVSYLAGEGARHPGRSPVPLWDFSGYSSVTTEPLPAPDSGAEMRYYWDSSHFKEEVGDWILDRLLGNPRANSSAPADFGVLLTPASIDAALDASRQVRHRYARDHASEVASLGQLVAVGRNDKGAE